MINDSALNKIVTQFHLIVLRQALVDTVFQIDSKIQPELHY